MSRSTATALLVASGLAIAPELAHACAVCGAGTGEDTSRVAYLITSAVLSVLPVSLLGGFLLWVRARSRRQARLNAQPAHATPATPTSL